jgi:hypothetical protein
VAAAEALVFGGHLGVDFFLLSDDVSVRCHAARVAEVEIRSPRYSTWVSNHQSASEFGAKQGKNANPTSLDLELNKEPLIWEKKRGTPVCLAYQPPANSTFLSQQISH